MEIYFDNSATTRPFEEVVKLMGDVSLNYFGNPSSRHNKGVEAEGYLKKAKEAIAGNLKCDTKEILFTSGGTESDNTALIGCANAMKRKGNHIITTRVEHPAILQTTEYLEKNGFEITYLPVDKRGIVDLEALKNALCERTIIVSVMFTNNEIGSTQPIEEISKIVKTYDKDILVHTDAVQGYGKYRIIPKKIGVDLMSVSGHKIHGPKGIGFLYVGNKVKMLPYIYGGGQQGGMRSGTENVPAIAGLGKAVELIYKDLDSDVEKLCRVRNYLMELLSDMDGIIINGPAGSGDYDCAAPHIVSVSVKGVRAEVLLHALEEKGIYVSSGSACASNKNTVSGTLAAIGLPKEYLESTIRMSLSVFNTLDEAKYVAEAIKEIVPELRKYTRR